MNTEITVFPIAWLQSSFLSRMWASAVSQTLLTVLTAFAEVKTQTTNFRAQISQTLSYLAG